MLNSIFSIYRAIFEIRFICTRILHYYIRDRNHPKTSKNNEYKSVYYFFLNRQYCRRFTSFNNNYNRRIKHELTPVSGNHQGSKQMGNKWLFGDHSLERPSFCYIHVYAHLMLV